MTRSCCCGYGEDVVGNTLGEIEKCCVHFPIILLKTSRRLETANLHFYLYCNIINNMNSIDAKPQIKWDQEKRIIYIDFVGHITKKEMNELIAHIEETLNSITQKPIKALHNFKQAEHVSIDAQILFSEHMQQSLINKHAFVSVNSVIRETIDIIITIAEQNAETMRIFEDEFEAVEWLSG